LTDFNNNNGAFLIRKARRKSGLTQKELAKKLGVTQPQVAHWESGRIKPSVDILAKIMDITKTRYESDRTVSGFATWLSDARKKKRISRKQLAEKAGLSYLTLYLIETGKTLNPHKATVQALTKILTLSIRS
jgi:transcriptional regulator with XRE-family HTH domain